MFLQKIFQDEKGMSIRELIVVILIITALAIGSIPLFHWLRSISPHQPEPPTTVSK